LFREQRKQEKEAEWMQVYQNSKDIASKKELQAENKIKKKSRLLEKLSHENLRDRLAHYEEKEKLKRLEVMLCIGIFLAKLEDGLVVGRQKRVHLVTFDPNDISMGYAQLLHQNSPPTIQVPPPLPPPFSMAYYHQPAGTTNYSVSAQAAAAHARRLSTAQEENRNRAIAKAIKFAKHVFKLHVAQIRSTISVIRPHKIGNPLVFSFVIKSKKIKYAANTIRNFIRNNDMGLQLFNCIRKFRYRVQICQRTLYKYKRRYAGRIELLSLLFKKCDKRRLSNKDVEYPLQIPESVRHQICKLIFEHQRKVQLDRMFDILNDGKVTSTMKQRLAAHVKTPSLVKEIEMLAIVNSAAQQYSMNLRREEKGEAANDYYLPSLASRARQLPVASRNQQAVSQVPVAQNMLQRLTRARTRVFLTRGDEDED